jgi:hypothetical protein
MNGLEKIKCKRAGKSYAMKWQNRLAQGFSPGWRVVTIALKVATESMHDRRTTKMLGRQ